MVGKKVILASLLTLLSIPLCGQQKNDKETFRDTAKFFYNASKEFVDMVISGIDHQKCSSFLKKVSDTFDDKNSNELFKGVQKTITEIRKYNRTKADCYQSTKSMLRLLFISCIKHHSNQKKECQKLTNLHTHYLAGVSLKEFLAIEEDQL